MHFERIVTIVLGAFLALPGCGSQELDTGTDDEVEAEVLPDGSWVSLTGTIVTATDESFVLDYGEGAITVEMDDWDSIGDAAGLLPNDDVVVYGYIDDDFFETRTIEASSVYVRDLGTTFYASGVDEEDVRVTTVVDFHPRIELSGTVTNVGQREFELDTGAGVVDINTEMMGYDPLDEEGFQQVEVGDRVRVRGELGQDLFDDLDLMADTVISMSTGGEAEAEPAEAEGEA
ncbi:MAG TPA: hypothetical protein RMH99_22760 [Sandaracinaceae bacterium LLY-WYZ-13_1]|nr:hypothetical protein [Sandaracinaceae bacterium LLY-WYZ-13_1]